MIKSKIITEGLFLTEKIIEVIIAFTVYLAWGDIIFLKEKIFIVAEKLRSDGNNV